MNKTGRPKGAKNSQKEVFTSRLKPSLIQRIERRAKKEQRTKNNLVEMVLDLNV